VYLQTPRAGKSHAHSPSKLLTQTKIHASWEGRGPFPIPFVKFQDKPMCAIPKH
jgi:hypothetical protein